MQQKGFSSNSKNLILHETYYLHFLTYEIKSCNKTLILLLPFARILLFVFYCFL